VRPPFTESTVHNPYDLVRMPRVVKRSQTGDPWSANRRIGL
jgi:hypothetical protein